MHHLVSYFAGIAIIFISHIYMLAKGMPQEHLALHAYLNLFAGVMIAYYFLNKEEYISW
jgi:hypothetical protein